MQNFSLPYYTIKSGDGANNGGIQVRSCNNDHHGNDIEYARDSIMEGSGGRSYNAYL